MALAVISRLLPTVKNERATRNFDIVGGAIFTVAISFLLVGLTNKQFGEWTDPTVGGFILVGLIGSVLFLIVESRAKEPIVPLDLWRGRTYSASMVSTFFASFAFFGAIVFLPRWFQVSEAFLDRSGPAAPSRVGLIGARSRPASSWPGRAAKWLLVGSIALMGLATLLMTQLTADTPVEVVWLWMFLAGLGVGPTFSVFTIVIQNAVPFHELGVATSNLTFFRQIGGTVALAFVGTIFATSFEDNIGPQMTAAGVPRRSSTASPRPAPAVSPTLSQLTGVGDLGAAILAGPGRVPGSHHAVHRRDGRGHPRRIQPGGRPDVLARGAAARRGGHRGGRHQGAAARSSNMALRRQPPAPRPAPGARAGRPGGRPAPTAD